MATGALPDETLADHREALERLDAALEHPEAAARREAIKADIIQLYKAVDRDLVELAEFKERLRSMAQRWKSLAEPEADTPAPGAPPAADPPPAALPEAIVPEPPADVSRRLDRLNASTYIEKGWSLIALGEHAEAEAIITRALALDDASVEARSLLGWAQMLQEKYDDALGNFQRVLMAEPANALARVNLGYICLKKGIFGEAIEHLSKAVRLNNDRKATLYANYYLGLLYSQRDMHRDAEQFYRKAIALGPNLIEAHFELGRACWRLGEKENALAAWRGGATANKFSPWGKRCAQVVHQVEAGAEPSLDS